MSTGLLVILRRPRLLRWHKISHVIDDVILRAFDLHMSCNLRSMFVVDQRDPIRSGNLALHVVVD